MRDIGHLPPAGRPPAPPLGFRSPTDHRSFGSSSASRCDKRSVESIPVGGPLTAAPHGLRRVTQLRRLLHRQRCCDTRLVSEREELRGYRVHLVDVVPGHMRAAT